MILLGNLTAGTLSAAPAVSGNSALLSLSP
jgi:hypothetical protein